jgi:BlaI family penicillinase repressor
MTKEKLGQVQLRIMQLLWKRKRATARELTDELNQSEAIAHSTVQTLLRQLEAKGSVGHEQEGRTFYFTPLVKEDKVKKSAARELIQSVFGGNASGLVSYLLETEKISASELAEIRKQIEQKKNKPKK